jgi:hypothetical protein
MHEMEAVGSSAILLLTNGGLLRIIQNGNQLDMQVQYVQGRKAFRPDGDVLVATKHHGQLMGYLT